MSKANEIRDRLEAAIHEADESSLSHIRASRDVTADAAKAFNPVRQAAEEIREQLQSLPSINFTINPESVCVTLLDRELWFSYDTQSRKYIGEESAHSWYEGERYAEHHEWMSAEECSDAIIGLCAQVCPYGPSNQRYHGAMTTEWLRIVRGTRSETRRRPAIIRGHPDVAYAEATGVQI